MTQNYIGGQPPYYAPPRRRRRLKVWHIVVLAIVLMCGGLTAIGAAVGGSTTKPLVTVTNTHAAVAPVNASSAPAPSPTHASPTPAGPPPPPPPPSINDGTYTVGEDFPAGVYKTTGAGDECFWSIYKSGTNQSDIIDNHIGAGNLRVTLKVGEDFETERCGTWIKVG